MAAPPPPRTHAGGVASARKTPSLPARRRLAIARPERRWHPPAIGRHALVVASLLLAATTAAGCSDDGSAGVSDQEASVARFCQGLQDFRDSVSAADSTDIAAYIQALKAAAAAVASLGVPDDMPAEAERGFELTIDRIQDLSDDATQEDVAQLGDVDDEDQSMLDALEDYIEDACPDLVGGETSG